MAVDNTEAIEAQITTDTVVKALKLNATHGVDDRVIAVSRHGGNAKIRRAFKGAERYADPDNAPIHIRPKALVKDGWERPPQRHEVDCMAIGVSKLPEERSDEDEAAIYYAHDELVDCWETDVRGMLAQTHNIDTDPAIALTVTTDN